MKIRFGWGDKLDTKDVEALIEKKAEILALAAKKDELLALLENE